MVGVCGAHSAMSQSVLVRLLPDAAQPVTAKTGTSTLLTVLVVVMLLAVVSGAMWIGFGMMQPTCTQIEPARGVALKTAKNSTAPLRFYLYEELNNVAPATCYACGTYTCVMQAFVTRLLMHEWRTMDPRQADVFVIPFSVFGSLMAGNCGSAHWERVVNVLRVLERSEWFRRSRGRDHFWLVPHYMLGGKQFADFLNPAFLHEGGVLAHVVFGRYWRIRSRALSPLPGRRDDWTVDEMSWMRTFGLLSEPNMVFRRNVVAPMHASFFYDFGTPDAAWTAWKARPKLFLFRGGHRDCIGATQQQRNFLMKGATMCCAMSDESRMWAHTSAEVAPLLSRSSMHRNVAASVETYLNEIQTHKFCFVVRCDDMQTSRFLDALAADCIPVLVSDGWRWIVAPFFEKLNYDSFTFT